MEIKEQLNKDYYGTKMLSVSSVKHFAQNPARALDDWLGKEEWFSDDKALTFGNFVHSGVQDALEGTTENHDTFVKEHPEMFRKDGKGLLSNYRLAQTVLDTILKSTVYEGLVKASKELKMFTETPFTSEYQGIKYKGKLDLMFVDDANKKVHCIDFKTSRTYPQNGIEWGELLDGTRSRTSVVWHVDKLFPVQAGTYRQLLQDNGYSDYEIDYTYIVATKESSPRIDVWSITDEAMDKGLDIFLENLVLANDYITGKQTAPVVYDDSPWAHKLTLKTPNKLVAEVLEEDKEKDLNTLKEGEQLFTGVI